MKGNRALSVMLFFLLMVSLFIFYQEEVQAQTVDYIVLTDAPNGTELTVVFLDIGGQVTAYASGYNTTSGYVDLVEVDWNGTGGNWSNSTGTSSTFTAGNTSGLYTQVGLNATLNVSDTFDVEILSHSIDYIIIRDEPGGGGNWVGPRFYILWESDMFYAAGYNSTYGYVEDVFVTWNSSNESVGTVSPNGTYTSFYPVGGGTCVVTADYGGGITNDTGILTVVVLDEIIIRDGPNGMGNPVLNRSYYIGENDTFWVAGYNNTYGFICDMEWADWWSDNTSVGTISPDGTPGGQNYSSAFFEAVGAGTCIIHVYSGMGMMNQTGTITVIAYDVDYVIIRDSPRGDGSPVGDMVYKIGDSDVFYAAGYNLTVGYVGDVSVTWNSSDPNVGTVTTNGSSTTFNAVGAGTCIVTADLGGGISNDTGVLTVAEVDYILIRDAPNNGGSEIEEMFYFTWGYGGHFYAAGYNDTYGYLGDVSVTWMSSNKSVGTVDPSSGYSTYFDPIGDGTCIVTANYGGITDETGIITVSSATVDYIQIRDAPDGGGDVVIDPLYILGSVDTYYGALYNNTVGYLCDVPPGQDQDSFWNSSNMSVVTVTPQGGPATITCSDTNPGTAVITLYALGLLNTTNVTVVSWTIDYISIMDAPDGAGNYVVDRTYGVWDADTFYAIGFNYTFGYVIDVTASWNCNDTDVGTVTSPGVSSTFTAQWVTTDSTCNVTATYNSLSNTTGILTVLAPRTDYVQIQNASGGGGAVITSISYQKGNTDTYYGATYNNTVGFIGSVPQTSTWESTDPSIVDVTSPGNYSDITCSDTNSGTVNVTLDDGMGHINITTVTVLNYTVDYILIRDAPLGGGVDLTDPANYPSYPVGHETTFYGAMYNNSAGYLGEVSSISTWISTNTNVVEVTSPGVSSTITCSDTNYGVATIYLIEWMGLSTTTQVEVLEPTIDYMKIMDASNGIGYEVGDMVYIIGDDDIFYAAAFNSTAGYFRDISVSWTSNDTSVGTVTTPGVSTNFTAVGRGTCVVTGYYGGGIMDSTGSLTVTLPSNITVDDSGGAHFTTIQEAIDAANPGDTIYVYSGTYFEHLTIDKSLTLIGENKETTIIDGEGYGKVIYVSGDDVGISGFTIQNGEYGIYCDESDSAYIHHNILRDYTYGIYNHQTIDGWITHNKITSGKYGIVTYEAYNDAIRYNTISYNTVYGAKDYNSQLKNCFNWNSFHHNHIAYYYDPDTPLSVLEFDGNTLEDNYIAIMVENASTISITNNTMLRNEYGIYLINASPNISDNTISTSNYGIYAEHSSPMISNNEFDDISSYAIHAENGDSLEIMDNSLTDTEMIIYDSTIKELSLVDSNIKLYKTTLDKYHLEGTSSLEVLWFLQIRVVDDEGIPIEGAAVLVYDAYDALVSTHITDSEGGTEWILAIVTLENSTSTIVYNPYRIEVTKGSLMNTSVITIEGDTAMVVSLQSEEVIIKPAGPAFPLGLVILIGFIGAIGVSGLCIEVMKYGLLTLFLPLYSRIKRERLLDQPTRERIYGYIIGVPGAHFGLIKEELALGSGQLVHHLKQLQDAHLIYSREDGIKKRFYPMEISRPKSRVPHFSEIQEKILGIIKNNSGIGQKRIASSIGISRQVAGYHLTKMERKGLIEKEVIGRESRYYPSEKYSV